MLPIDSTSWTLFRYARFFARPGLISRLSSHYISVEDTLRIIDLAPAFSGDSMVCGGGICRPEVMRNLVRLRKTIECTPKHEHTPFDLGAIRAPHPDPEARA